MNTDMPTPMSRKKAWTVMIIRWILALGLTYGIFLETGVCTTIFASLLLVGSEIQTILVRRALKHILELYTIFSMMFGQSYKDFKPEDPDRMN